MVTGRPLARTHTVTIQSDRAACCVGVLMPRVVRLGLLLGSFTPVSKRDWGFCLRESRAAQARVVPPLGARDYARSRPSLSARVLTRQRGSDGLRSQTLGLSPVESASGLRHRCGRPVQERADFSNRDFGVVNRPSCRHPPSIPLLIHPRMADILVCVNGRFISLYANRILESSWPPHRSNPGLMACRPTAGIRSLYVENNGQETFYKV